MASKKSTAARGVQRAAAAASGWASLRDCIRRLSADAVRLGRRAGSNRRGSAAAVQEVLLALSNCIDVREREDADGHRRTTFEGVDVNLLERLHRPAREALARAEGGQLRADGVRTGVRFVNPTSGGPRKTAAGLELVAIVAQYVQAGLRGEALADAIADDPIWQQSAFDDFPRIRWKDPAKARELVDSFATDERARLEAFCRDPRIDFDDVSDFDALTVKMLGRMGMDPRAARNAVCTAADAAAARKGRSRGKS